MEDLRTISLAAPVRPAFSPGVEALSANRTLQRGTLRDGSCLQGLPEALGQAGTDCAVLHGITSTQQVPSKCLAKAHMNKSHTDNHTETRKITHKTLNKIPVDLQQHADNSYYR